MPLTCVRIYAPLSIIVFLLSVQDYSVSVSTFPFVPNGATLECFDITIIADNLVETSFEFLSMNLVSNDPTVSSGSSALVTIEDTDSELYKYVRS